MTDYQLNKFTKTSSIIFDKITAPIRYNYSANTRTEYLTWQSTGFALQVV